MTNPKTIAVFDEAGHEFCYEASNWEISDGRLYLLESIIGPPVAIYAAGFWKRVRRTDA